MSYAETGVSLSSEPVLVGTGRELGGIRHTYLFVIEAIGFDLLSAGCPKFAICLQMLLGPPPVDQENRRRLFIDCHLEDALDSRHP